MISRRVNPLFTLAFVYFPFFRGSFMIHRKASAPTLVTTLHPRNKLFVLDTNV